MISSTKLSVYLANPTIPATASTTGVKRVVDNTHLDANAGTRSNVGTTAAKNTYIVYYSIK